MRFATAAISAESERSLSTGLETDRTSCCAFCARGPVANGARNSIPWQAARSSMASTLRRFSSIEESRLAAPIPILLWKALPSEAIQHSVADRYGNECYGRSGYVAY